MANQTETDASAMAGSSDVAAVTDASPTDTLVEDNKGGGNGFLEFEAAFRAYHSDHNAHGAAFEPVVKWLLENHPIYKPLFKKVWLWNDWPGADGPDNGIDLVAETGAGDLWAIQSKCFKEENTVPREEVTSFLAESSQSRFKERLLVSTTDLVARNAERTIAKQEKPFHHFNREDFLTAPVNWSFDAWIGSGTPATAKAKPTPRPYQEPVIANVVDTLGDRGQLIMACGTGKTLTSLWIDEALNNDLTLVLVPSLTLLSQLVSEWTANSADGFKFLPVCSDDSVADKAEDHLAISASELSFPVTTDPDEIAAFMKGDGKRIVFSTYQSSPKIAEAQQDKSVPAFDIVFADEAHRCAGKVSTAYSTVLDGEELRADKRLFMTATPRVFTTRVRSKAAEHGAEMASMDDHTVFGPVVDRISFAQAINEGMLTDYQVAVILVDDTRIRDLIEDRNLVETAGGVSTDAASLAGRVGFLKAVKDFGLRRTISFHSRVKAAQRFAAEIGDVAAWMPATQRPPGPVQAGFVSGAMSTGERNAGLNQLRNVPDGEHGVLANARCLSEGVDVPSLDGVAFIDPRKSQVDIVQAVGRAIRLAPGKQLGTIVIPVYVSSTDDPADVLSGSEFKPVWDVVNALRSHDDDLAEELDELRLSLGKRHPGGPKLPDKIIIDAPESIGGEFSTALRTMLVERSTDDWLNWYAALQQFADHKGHANVTVTHVESFNGEDLRLGAWVNTQRTERKSGNLPKDREALLSALSGWAWDAQDASWQRRFAALQQFATREGHANVPKTHVERFDGEDLKLGSWVTGQRNGRTSGKLTTERVILLNSIPGWVWNTAEAAWHAKYAALKQFEAREGHLKVPKTHVERLNGEALGLGAWVGQQRLLCKSGKLLPERKALLIALPNWFWDPHEAAWQNNYAALQQYVAREGNANVPKGRVEPFGGEDLKLGMWVSSQRTDFKKGKLPAERVALLLAVPGWFWDAEEDAWSKKFAALKQFQAREGHASVQHGFVEHFNGEDLNLGAWVTRQRHFRKSGRLTEDQEKLLTDLPGWIWDTNEAVWKAKYAALRQFEEREGHANVKQGHIEVFNGEDLKLGTWCTTQRSVAKAGKLDPERKRLLEDLPGWHW